MAGQSKIWGHGRWQSIHVTAAWSDTPEKFKMFGPWVRNQIEKLPCQECIDEAKSYIEIHPPEKAEDAFMWSWRFHNSVNRRLHKPEMEYTTAANIYLGDGFKVCNEGCDEGKNKTKPIENTFNFRSSRF